MILSRNYVETRSKLQSLRFAKTLVVSYLEARNVHFHNPTSTDKFTYIIREPGSTLLRVPHPSLLRVRGLNLLFSCSRCCGPNRSSSSVAVRCPIPPFPASSHKPFKHLHLQLFLDKDRNHVVTCYLILSNHSRRTAPQAAPLRNLCVLRVSALDSSSLGLTLNLQLSTLDRVSFFSSHLSLSQRSAKSFTIRTSETPLPQLLYNPHLQAPLGSAGNKGLITPLES